MCWRSWTSSGNLGVYRPEQRGCQPTCVEGSGIDLDGLQFANAQKGGLSDVCWQQGQDVRLWAHGV